MAENRRRRVVLGVSGGIAAYKACLVLRGLTEAGHQVDVVPTPAALRFVGEATWAALSGRPVHSDVFDDVPSVTHVRLGQSADLVVVVPATADLMARAAHGHADDLLTNVLLTTRSPIVLFPAMHTEMWDHPATRANVATLRSRGTIVVDPDSGRLTGADSGPGRLAEPESILALLRAMLVRAEPVAADLEGRHLVVTAGGTREFLDPVRFLGNRSSGRQGFAIAAAALVRGARVSLVCANVSLPAPAGADVAAVVSARDMHAALVELSPQADVVVMAAAVADFRPGTYQETKIKKDAAGGAPALELVRNPDLLAGLAGHADRPSVLVGFAAETGDPGKSVLEHGWAKLTRKGVDLLVVNEVGAAKGFESLDNEAVILAADGSSTSVALGPKEALAHALLDRVAAALHRR